MEMRELNLEEMLKIREERMPQDFNEIEIKPAAVIRYLYEAGKYKAYGYFEEDTLLAYSFFQKFDEFYLWDYVAVTRARRNAGIGKKFMDQMRRDLFKNEFVLAEVENPAFALTVEDRSIMERRIAYYVRNGIRETGIPIKIFGVHYLLMVITPDETVDNAEIIRMYREFWNQYRDIIQQFAPEHLENFLTSTEIPEILSDFS